MSSNRLPPLLDVFFFFSLSLVRHVPAGTVCSGTSFCGTRAKVTRMRSKLCSVFLTLGHTDVSSTDLSHAHALVCFAAMPQKVGPRIYFAFSSLFYLGMLFLVRTCGCVNKPRGCVRDICSAVPFRCYKATKRNRETNK